MLPPSVVAEGVGYSKIWVSTRRKRSVFLGVLGASRVEIERYQMASPPEPSFHEQVVAALEKELERSQGFGRAAESQPETKKIAWPFGCGSAPGCLSTGSSFEFAIDGDVLRGGQGAKASPEIFLPNTGMYSI